MRIAATILALASAGTILFVGTPPAFAGLGQSIIVDSEALNLAGPARAAPPGELVRIAAVSVHSPLPAVERHKESGVCQRADRRARTRH